MNAYTLASIILSLAVLLSYINYHFIKIQGSITSMIASLLISLVLIVLQHTGLSNLSIQTKAILLQTDFHSLLINGMLSFLLFAGALTIDFNDLKVHGWEIGTLASISTLVSAFIIGSIIFYLFPVIGLPIPFLYCLLFGALISPTDPIAVLTTFKHLNVPNDVTICVEGEALFNDGVGIIIFITFFQLIFQDHSRGWQGTGLLFIQQALGGITYGALLGKITHYLIKHTNNSKNAILITLMVATGGYSLALALNLSGALAMVVAGIFIGNSVRKNKLQTQIRRDLDIFWEVIDEVLNAVLFLLIGFELLLIHATYRELVAAVITIPIVLLVRLGTVALPMKMLQLKRHHNPYLIHILTWGGLRGGLAVALALSLPSNQYRELILVITYAVVTFSILIQGTTIKPLAKLALHYSPTNHHK